MDKDSRRSSTPKPFKFSIFGKSKTNLDGAEAPSSAAAAMDATTPANDTALDKTPDMTDLSSIPKAYETGKQATASKPIFSYWFKSNTTRPIQQPVSFLSNDSLKEDGMGHERQNADLPAHEGPLSEEESSADSQDDSHDILITPHHKDISTDERVRIAFELPNVDKVEYEFACWLVQAVLLKGYMGYSVHLQKHNGIPVIMKDVYYPVQAILLKTATSVQAIDGSETAFTVRTEKKKYYFKADTNLSRSEWLKVLNAAIFAAKNGIDDVRVVIPFENINKMEVQKTEINDECLSILATDHESLISDTYKFAYFNDTAKVFKSIAELLPVAADILAESGRSYSPQKAPFPHPSDIFQAKDAKIPHYLELASDSEMSDDRLPRKNENIEDGIARRKLDKPEKRQNWWGPRRSSLDESQLSNTTTIPTAKVSEPSAVVKYSWWSPRMSLSLGLLSTAAPSEAQLLQKKLDFQALFAFPESEQLIASYGVYLVKVLSHLGKVYVSDNHVSFKNRLVGVRARAIIPINQISKVEVGYRYGFNSAMTLTTVDREEILFDFHTHDSCVKCSELITSMLSVEPKPSLSRSTTILDDIQHYEHHVATNLETCIQILILDDTLEPAVAKKHAKMKIICITIGTRGDVQPYIALCLGFIADGHDCILATHIEYKDWIEGFGIEFREIKGNPAELMRLCVDYGMFTIAFIRHASANFRGWIDELLLSCWEASQDADLIIESPTAMGGMHVAEKLGIPFFRGFPMPWSRTSVYPHPFAVPERKLGSGYNYMSHVIVEQVLWKGISPQVNAWRKKVLGLSAIHISSLAEIDIPMLYSFSPSIVPPPSDWPDWIHTTGYWFLDEPELSWNPPDSLLDFIKVGPPVYIGFGSIVVQDADEMTRIIIQAVEQAGVRVILCKGWSDRLSSGIRTKFKYPDSIHCIDRAPHDWLFPKMAGVVHHGGAGTTAAGIRAGVPTAIRPFFGDQYFWAERICDLGVGVALKKFTVAKLAQALISISTDVKMKEKARILSEKVKRENGVQTAIQYVYRDLQLANEQMQSLKAKESN